MSKKSSLEKLANLTKSALEGGGAEKAQQQDKLGKLTARKRIEAIFDAGSFIELDKFAQKSLAAPGFECVSAAGEGVITGFGTIDERPCYAYVQDYTVLNGSLSVAQAEKIAKVMDMAAKNGAPVVGVIDCGGARVSEGAAAMNAFGIIAKKLSDISGVVPTIAVVAGQAIGSIAYIAALNDFCISVDKISEMLLSGSMVIESATGEKADGSAQAQNSFYAAAQFNAKDEAQAYAIVKDILDYLPSNNMDDTFVEMTSDDVNRIIPELDEKEDIDTKEIIEKIADNGKFTEYQAEYAKNIITGFARINGYSVGIIANNNGAALCSGAADKAARFISILDAYNMPIITLTDTADILPAESVKDHSIINSVAKLMGAYCSATVPMINVIVGKAVSTGLAAMCSKTQGADVVFAWANAVISALPVETGALIVYEKEIADGLKVADAIAKYEEETANAFNAASQGIVDDVIAPSTTRQMIGAAIEASIMKKESPIAKKHNIMPL